METEVGNGADTATHGRALDLLNSALTFHLKMLNRDIIHECMRVIRINTYKLRTYRLFKDTFDLEPYLLNVKNTSYRVALTRLRVGSHSLAIEVGRFHKPIPLPINDRLCSICQSVEDELHFLCICPRYSTIREDLEYGVSSYFPGFKHLSAMQKFVFLLQSTHTHINNLVAAFVHNSFRIRMYDQ